MKWNKVTAILLAAMLVVLSACSSSGSKDGASDNVDVIKVWTYPVHGNYKDDIAKSVAEFHAKHPNIRIEYELLTWAEGPKKFDVALNAGSPPDIYYHGVSGQYVDTGLALNLDPFMTDEIVSDYLPGVLDKAKIQGKQYGLPMYQYQWAWSANQRILEEAGIDWRKIQKEGWTWSEFKTEAKKMVKDLPDGSKQYGIVTDATTTDFIEMLARSSGLVDVVNRDGKFIWNDDRMLETLKFIRSLVDEGIMPKETAAIDPAKRVEYFYNGKTGIASKGLPYYDVMLETRAKDIDAGKVKGEKIEHVYLPIPYRDGGKWQATVGGEGYVGFRQKDDKGEQHAKNTFLVMDWLTKGVHGGNSAYELCVPFARQSQVDAFKDKGDRGKPYNKEAAEINQSHGVPSSDLYVDAKVSASKKKFIEQAQKPMQQALFSGSRTPEQIFEEFKNKGEQLFR
ncbi:extracellular solute-binding protein [Paenibacillus sp. SC116]|uniref:ABC transporter substrate-binding protein n=1 Tax=Paenibacillus sp. SC116 TaxID=2968986 RepID=UPI00215AF1CA|nr:extracellular solute-binding protein [Paenibacillus sp. SC116]MCR8843457.1 extracellular solute-binding protein [Paenibacillus sp. SC116]